MVGHTGVWEATVRAVETIDACLGRIVDVLEAATRRDSVGPAPPGARRTTGTPTRCVTPTAKPVTAHSLNPVPVPSWMVAASGRTLHDGVLADVAPTLLELAGLSPLGRG